MAVGLDNVDHHSDALAIKYTREEAGRFERRNGIYLFERQRMSLERAQGKERELFEVVLGIGLLQFLKCHTRQLERSIDQTARIATIHDELVARRKENTAVF